MSPVPAAPRIGVLLVNLGTPDAPTRAAVKRYLGEFLSDRRVVEIPPLLWQPILRGIILNSRPKKSAHAYAQVWTDDGSPLAAITRRQTAAVAARFATLFGDRVIVDFAMRYGNPALGARIAAMKAAGCERILVAPLYPQYCGATTASVNDAAFAAVAAMRWQPAIRTLPPYYEDPAYIAALKLRVEAELAALDFEPDTVVVSFHGMPQRTRDLGDPYHDQCQATAKALSAALGRELTVTFQSRFGRARWLEPATDTRLVELAKAGHRRVAVVAPGFSADCIETLEELAIRGRADFMSAGGERFAYLACLNDSDAGIAMLEKLLVRELEGWATPA
jgi:ferrochelatase